MAELTLEENGPCVECVPKSLRIKYLYAIKLSLYKAECALGNSEQSVYFVKVKEDISSRQIDNASLLFGNMIFPIF